MPRLQPFDGSVYSRGSNHSRFRQRQRKWRGRTSTDREVGGEGDAHVHLRCVTAHGLSHRQLVPESQSCGYSGTGLRRSMDGQRVRWPPEQGGFGQVGQLGGGEPWRGRRAMIKRPQGQISGFFLVQGRGRSRWGVNFSSAVSWSTRGLNQKFAYQLF